MADTRVDADPPKKSDDPDDAYAHLPPHEAEILKRQVFTPDVKTGVLTLYRYSSTTDLLIRAAESRAAIAAGAALPLMTVLFGSLQGTFQEYFTPGTGMTYDDFMDEIVKLILYFVYLAIGEFVSETCDTPRDILPRS
jgi:ATP-binding cassette subfamily B (MDR/TAP) protein 1